MRTYAVTLQCTMTTPDDKARGGHKASWPAIEADDEVDALERAMLLFELEYPLHPDECHWHATINGRDFRLWWFCDRGRDGLFSSHGSQPEITFIQRVPRRDR